MQRFWRSIEEHVQDFVTSPAKTIHEFVPILTGGALLEVGELVIRHPERSIHPQ